MLENWVGGVEENLEFDFVSVKENERFLPQKLGWLGF